MPQRKNSHRRFQGIYRILIAISAVFVILSILLIYLYKDVPGTTGTGISTKVTDVPAFTDPDRVENGIHIRTGLIAAEGLTEVVANCTSCHSAQLVIQNRMGKERWEATIRWMQETQNLWELGKNQDIIIDYLVKNYPPQKKGRREALTQVEWYKLEGN